MTTATLDKSKFKEFRDYLKRIGFSFESREYQVFLARYDKFTLNLYESGKITMTGKDDKLRREIEWYLEKLGAAGTENQNDEFRKLEGEVRIGTDEAGKGDYFGPLVVAAAIITPALETKCRDIGISDSKKHSDKGVIHLARELKELLGKTGYDIITIGPKRYNELYSNFGNLNKLLGWAHARAIENLLKSNPGCGLAVADKFGKTSDIGDALQQRGQKIDIVQLVHGEADMAVASASILARAAFLEELESLGKRFDMKLPKGATSVIGPAREFIKRHGNDCLGDVAKLHFRTTSKL